MIAAEHIKRAELLLAAADAAVARAEAAEVSLDRSDEVANFIALATAHAAVAQAISAAGLGE